MLTRAHFFSVCESNKQAPYCSSNDCYRMPTSCSLCVKVLLGVIEPRAFFIMENVRNVQARMAKED